MTTSVVSTMYSPVCSYPLGPLPSPSLHFPDSPFSLTLLLPADASLQTLFSPPSLPLKLLVPTYSDPAVTPLVFNKASNSSVLLLPKLWWIMENTEEAVFLLPVQVINSRLFNLRKKWCSFLGKIMPKVNGILVEFNSKIEARIEYI